jgi:hypothetical protein
MSPPLTPGGSRRRWRSPAARVGPFRNLNRRDRRRAAPAAGALPRCAPLLGATRDGARPGLRSAGHWGRARARVGVAPAAPTASGTGARGARPRREKARPGRTNPPQSCGPRAPRAPGAGRRRDRARDRPDLAEGPQPAPARVSREEATSSAPISAGEGPRARRHALGALRGAGPRHGTGAATLGRRPPALGPAPGARCRHRRPRTPGPGRQIAPVPA